MVNQYTPDNRRQRIAAFVRANPACSTREVADAFGMQSRYIGSELDQLARGGVIRSLRAYTGRRLYWEATDKTTAPIQTGAEEVRVFSKTWTPHMVRDALTAALFGPAPAQVAA